jgi:hypothetical protein
MSKSILKLVTCFTKQAQIQQGMVIEKNGFYQTSANYQNKKLMVNGKDMSAIVQQLI